MIDLLLGVPGKLKAVYDYLTTNWTTTRAAKLDYLTANVAVASTALSNAQWTNARAAQLDLVVANPQAKPPISTNTQTNKVLPQAITFYGGYYLGTESFSTASSTLVDVLNITSGSGVLEFLAAGQTDATAGRQVRLVVTIDGTVAYDNTATSGGTPSHATLCFAGMMGVSLAWDGTQNVYLPFISALSNIPFAASLRIQMSSSVGTSYAYFKYRRTS